MGHVASEWCSELRGCDVEVYADGACCPQQWRLYVNIGRRRWGAVAARSTSRGPTASVCPFSVPMAHRTEKAGLVAVFAAAVVSTAADLLL